MKLQTGLRAGVTLPELLQNIGVDLRNTAAQAVVALDNAAQDANDAVQGFLYDSNVRENVAKAFWWPLDPPR